MTTITRQTLNQLTCLGLLALSATHSAWAQNLLTNGDFNAPLVPPVSELQVPAKYLSAPPTGWATAGDDCSSGACANSAFINKAIGDQALPYGVSTDGMLAAIYNTATLSQSFSVASGGNFTLAWSDSSAQSVNTFYVTGAALGGRYLVLLDGVSLGQFETSLPVGFTEHALGLQLSAGNHTLAFQGLDPAVIRRFGSNNQYSIEDAAHMVLLDNVSISAVPESGTWLLMGLGLGLVGWRVRTARRA